MLYEQAARTWRTWLDTWEESDGVLAILMGWVVVRCDAVPPRDPEDDDLTFVQRNAFVACMRGLQATVERAFGWTIADYIARQNPEKE